MVEVIDFGPRRMTVSENYIPVMVSGRTDAEDNFLHKMDFTYTKRKPLKNLTKGFLLHFFQNRTRDLGKFGYREKPERAGYNNVIGNVPVRHCVDIPPTVSIRYGGGVLNWADDIYTRRKPEKKMGRPYIEYMISEYLVIYDED